VHEPAVFSQLPEWAHKKVPKAASNDFWAPDIYKVDNEFRMYYSVSSFGSQVSCIGLATSNSTAGHIFVDKGEVLCSADGELFNAIGPCPFQQEGGTGHFLVFGSFWSGVYVAQLDAASGKLGAKPIGPIARSPASGNPIEAAYVMPAKGFYFLFVNWGFCCRGTESTYRIMVGRRKLPIGPYLDRSGKDMASGGGDLFLNTTSSDKQNEIGPGQFGLVQSVDPSLELFTYHFYDKDSGGAPTLGIRTMNWETLPDGNLWPSPGP
jgi:arabinan endo-1,5-alpha-L-arabinosidase